jgi:hypothetical protein
MLYSRTATVAAILAFMAVAVAEVDVATVRKTFARDSARIQAHKLNIVSADKVNKKSQRLGQSIQTAPTYVTVNFYVSTDCSNAQPYSSITYGTNMCLAISGTTGVTAGSTQYTWDSTNNVLNEVYYSDDTCATSVAMGVVYNFTSDDVAGTCVNGMEYTTSSAFTIPEGGYAIE